MPKDRLWAPWRMQYVEHHPPDTSEGKRGCIFCDFPAENDDAKNMILDHGIEEKKRGEAREQTLRELFGSKVDENVTLAQRSMEMVGGPACREELESSGLLRSPVQVRAWKRIWEAIGEDRIFAGAADPDGTTQEARLKALYPNTEW